MFCSALFFPHRVYRLGASGVDFSRFWFLFLVLESEVGLGVEAEAMRGPADVLVEFCQARGISKVTDWTASEVETERGGFSMSEKWLEGPPA